MNTIQLVLIVAALLGAIVYLLSNDKASEIGRIVAFCAFLAFCFSLIR